MIQGLCVCCHISFNTGLIWRQSYSLTAGKKFAYAFLILHFTLISHLSLMSALCDQYYCIIPLFLTSPHNLVCWPSPFSTFFAFCFPLELLLPEQNYCLLLLIFEGSCHRFDISLLPRVISSLSFVNRRMVYYCQLWPPECPYTLLHDHQSHSQLKC